jgi:hypothetical protein
VGDIEPNMDRVLERKTKYSKIALQLDPEYDNVVRAIDIVKQFIAEHNGVIYGGTAIDYALRLRGDAIYDDESLDVPDLDFYLPDSVAGSRTLADILYNEGLEESRSIVAQHVETMRVDSGKNHFIADISYMPAEMLSQMRTITYSGMQCVHPDYQRCDMHSALSFPFDNAPREVIFARWKKDLARIDKIDAAYPVESEKDLPPAPTTETHKIDSSMPLYGWAAYCVLIRGRGKRIPATAQYNKGTLTFNTLCGLEYVSSKEIDSKCTKYYPYANLVFSRQKRDKITYYMTTNRLISCIRVRIGTTDILCVCAHGILHYMMGMYIFTGDENYRAAYCDLWELVCAADDPTLGLTIDTYGDENMNDAQLMQIKRIHDSNIEGLPRNYYPAKGVRPEEFLYDSHYFKIDGSEIK